MDKMETQPQEEFDQSIPEEVTENARCIYEELVKNVNLADLLGIVKLSTASLMETSVSEGNLDPEGVAADLMIEYSNAINDVKEIIKANQEIKEIIGDSDYIVSVIPLSNLFMYQRKEDGFTLIFNDKTKQVFSTTTDINDVEKEAIDDAHGKILSAFTELKKRRKKVMEQQREDTGEEPKSEEE